MSKIYRYEKLEYTGREDEEIIFEVKMISNGNEGGTNISTPITDELFIENSNSVSLGLLKSLTKSKTAAYSSVKNPAPISDDITVEFYINSKLLIQHSNPKSETKEPFIILKIKFIKS